MKNSKYLKIAGKILSFASIIFVIYAIWKTGFDYKTITEKPSFMVVFILGILLKIVSVVLSARTWTMWLSFWANKPVDIADGMCVHMKANIGKYLPGNVMHYVERNLFASQMGISQKRIATSTATEIICQILVALFIFLGTGYGTVSYVLGSIFSDRQYILIIFSICGAAMLVILLLWGRKLLSKTLSEYSIGSFAATLTGALFNYLVILSLLGIIMVILYAFDDGIITPSTCLSIVSGYIVAWVLGFIVPGASGGLGVREFVIIMLLSPIMGKETVVTLSVIHRLITVIGDFIAYFLRQPLSALSCKISRKNQ